MAMGTRPSSWISLCDFAFTSHASVAQHGASGLAPASVSVSLACSCLSSYYSNNMSFHPLGNFLSLTLFDAILKKRSRVAGDLPHAPGIEGDQEITGRCYMFEASLTTGILGALSLSWGAQEALHTAHCPRGPAEYGHHG